MSVISGVLLSFVSGSLVADQPSMNLLRAGNTILVRHSTSIDPARLPPLTDGNESTAGRIHLPTEGAEVVYQCGERVVTAEKLSVRVTPESSPVQIELFVSTVSSTTAFTLLRSELLRPGTGPQQFSFPPTAGRWFLLRFTPAQTGAEVAIAEMEIHGYDGPPRTRYAFKDAPAKAFDVLRRLKNSSSLDISIFGR